MAVIAAGSKQKVLLCTPASATTQKPGGEMDDAPLKSEFLSTFPHPLCYKALKTR